MDQSCQQLTQQEQQALWQLRARWLALYRVALADDVWRATRYDDVTKIITADSADQLGDKIKADYDAVTRS